MRKSLALLAIILVSCSKDHLKEFVTRPPGCDSTSFSFERNIKPIFVSNCNFSDCHASNGRGSYDFNLYSVVADRIKAGTMDYRLELPVDDPQHMPEKVRLSSCDYFIIKTWIIQGYPEN